MKYSIKHNVKLALFFIAILFVSAIYLVLTNTIIRIKQEERKEVMLWAEAIQNRYAFVAYTEKLLSKLQVEEQKKVELWSDAQHYLFTETNSSFLTFLLKIISSNENIPIILTDGNKNVVSSVNLLFDIEVGKPIPDSIKTIYEKYPPIAIRYDNEIINYLYYHDSHIFRELQFVMNEMMHNFIDDVVSNSASVPVIIANKDTTQILACGNIDTLSCNTPPQLKLRVAEMAKSNTPIPIKLNTQEQLYIYYEDSTLIMRLKYYPFVLVIISLIVIAFAYYLFRSSDKYERNQLMVGMSKETAHQLGTPISSLMAWVELLRLQEVDSSVINEINKDVTRLHTIAERFNKIGSAPTLELEHLNVVIQNALNYIQARTSKKVIVSLVELDKEVFVPINIHLFEWVIENVCKNAIDAMQGNGSLTVVISTMQESVIMDFKDTGKGILRKNFNTIFKPGYTTKQRGWGLGLSLAKRIIEEYHNGRIFVKSSEINQGSTIRITIPLT